MSVDDGFPTAVACNLQILSSLGHVQVAGLCFALATINGQAFISSCCRGFRHSQQGHACSFVIVISQLPNGAVLDVHYDAAAFVNIVAAGQLGLSIIQGDFNVTTVACIYITVNSAGCIAAVYSNVAAVGIDVTLNVQSAVVGVDIYIAICACVDCSVSAFDISAAVQGYVAVFSIDAYITTDAGVALNINVCTICIDTGLALQLQLSFGSIDVDVLVSCIYCSAAFNLNLSRILSEYIRAVFLQNAVLLVLIVSLGIAGNTLVLFSSFRLLGFRIGEARLHRTVLQTALTSISIEGNVAGLHCCRRSSQAVSNLNIASKILLAFDKAAVCQLACQGIQYISNAVFVVHADAAVVGNQGYYRAFCCTSDNGVACCIVISCFAVTGMCIVYVGIAAVVVDGNIISIVLEYVACVCCIAAAYEFSNMATYKATAAPRLGGFAPLLVVPGCTVLQEYIDCTVEGLVASFVAFILEAVMCNAGPYGICSCQAQVYFSIKLRLVSIHCTGRCTYVTLQYQLIVSSTDCIIVCIKVNVHACGSRFCHHCIVGMLVILVDFDIAATVNRQLSMTAVSKQAVTVNLGIYITIDSNLWSHLHRIVTAAVDQRAAIVTKSTIFRGQAPFTVFVTHSGYIAVKGYFGITCCVQA